MFAALQVWWAKRCAITALCTHLVEYGDQWKVTRDIILKREDFTFGELVVSVRHKYSWHSPTKEIYVNGARMPLLSACRIRAAIKRRGEGLRVYRAIVSTLKPSNTPLQIEQSLRNVRPLG